MVNYERDWKNLDPISDLGAYILDPLTLESVLLIVGCNIPTDELTEDRVLSELHKELYSKYREAYSILRSNVSMIVEHTKKSRED